MPPNRYHDPSEVLANSRINRTLVLTLIASISIIAGLAVAWMLTQ